MKFLTPPDSTKACQGTPTIHGQACTSRNVYSVTAGGFLPYLASYNLAYFPARLGSHLKHCDSARLCSSHQSPLVLKSLAALALHILHSSSGIPCSTHHQPEWSSAAATLVPVLVFFGAFAAGFSCAQPENRKVNPNKLTVKNKLLQRLIGKSFLKKLIKTGNTVFTQAND